MTDQYLGHYKLWEEGKKKHPPFTGPTFDPGPFFKKGGVIKTPSPISDYSTKEVEDMAEKEEVNHPDHYGGKDNQYETIKVLEAKLTRDEFIGFCKGSAIKYLDRAKLKGYENKDYRKAEWYLNYMNNYIERTPYENG